ncbi:MAG: response regulator [Firmicutes bacterium]|nr:response regulator [Bacillota bacterium]
MYKILIVDDEKLIRRGIIAKLVHNKIEFSWIGEASDGKEAWAMIESERPHIVITDVRMPVMDGIQLIKNCREKYPQMKFIVISGYAEFEYAEQALNMGASGYILKPIDDKKLAQIMRRVTEEISNYRKAEKNAREVLLFEKERESVRQEQILNQIFFSSQTLEEEILLQQINLPNVDQNTSYILALLHVDSSSFYQSSFKVGDLELIKFSIKNILNEIDFDCGKIFVDNLKDVNQLFLLFYDSDENKLKRSCKKFIINAFSFIQKYLNISITIAVSGVEGKLSNKIYKQASIAFDRRLIQGGNQIFFYEEINGYSQFSISKHKFKLLERCMEIYDLNGIQNVLNDIFSSKEAVDIPGIYIRLAYSEVISSLLKVCNRFDIKGLTDSEFLSGRVIDSFENSRQIVDYLYSKIVDTLKDKKLVRADCKKIIEDIEAFIQKNFASKITVAELAKKYAINPDYLSFLFKQETGENITKYLMEIRIERACKLLKETELTISDISYSVGYQDQQYFNRIFKKVIGMTPGEYRNLSKECSEIENLNKDQFKSRFLKY